MFNSCIREQLWNHQARETATEGVRVYLLQSNYFKKVSVDRTGGGVFPGFGNIDSLGTSASIDFQRGADSHPKIMGRGEQEMGGGGRRKSLERMWRWKNVV